MFDLYLHVPVKNDWDEDDEIVIDLQNTKDWVYDNVVKWACDGDTNYGPNPFRRHVTIERVL